MAYRLAVAAALKTSQIPITTPRALIRSIPLIGYKVVDIADNPCGINIQLRVIQTARLASSTPRPSENAPQPQLEISSKPVSPRVEETFRKIIQLDLVEVHLLTELVNQKMGMTLTSAQRDAMARGGSVPSMSAADGGETPVEDESKTSFDIKLLAFDTKTKIKVIKEIRTITNLGLKEAKEMVEGAPKLVKQGIKMEEAEELKEKLEAVGASVEIV